MKKNLLLVDSDSKSLRMLEISLRKAGFSLTTAVSAADAREKIAVSTPDLVITETRLPDASGIDLVSQLKNDPKTERIPMIFLSSEDSIEQKVRGLELGVEDYLTKPIYLKEVLTRVRILLDKLEKETVERRERSATFSGLLGEMGLVDLVQTVEIGRKTGRIFIDTQVQKGEIAFVDGKVVDASTGRLSGERAFYRMLVWSEGVFNMEFGPHDTPDVIELSTQGLLMEGMRRVDEWGRLLEQLPPLERAFEIDYGELVDRLAEIPDEINGILRLFDGHRSLLDVVDDSDFGDLEALEIASKLYFEGLIYDIETRSDEAAPRETAIEKWLDEDDPAPITPEETLPPTVEIAETASQIAEAESAFELAPPRVDLDDEDDDGVTLDDDDGWEDVHAPIDENDTQVDFAPPPVSISDEPADELADELGLSQRELAVIAADEPTTQMDPPGERSLEEELNEAFSDTPSTTPVSADALVRTDADDAPTRVDESASDESPDDDEQDVTVRQNAATVPGRPAATEANDAVPEEFFISDTGEDSDVGDAGSDLLPVEDDSDLVEYDDDVEFAPSPLWRNAASLALLGLVMFLLAYGYMTYFAGDKPPGDGDVVAAAEPEAAPTTGDPAENPSGAEPEGDMPEAEPEPATNDTVGGAQSGTATNVAANETGNKTSGGKPGENPDTNSTGADSSTKTTPKSTDAAGTKTAANQGSKKTGTTDTGTQTGGGKTRKGAAKVDAEQAAADRAYAKEEAAAEKAANAFAAALNKATAMAKRGKHKSSIKHFKSAIRANAKSSAAHLGLANAYYELNSLSAATVHAEQARALSPRDPQVYVLLGAVYQSSGKKPEAIAAYKKYLELAPNGRFARELKNVLASLKGGS